MRWVGVRLHWLVGFGDWGIVGVLVGGSVGDVVGDFVGDIVGCSVGEDVRLFVG